MTPLKITKEIVQECFHETPALTAQAIQKKYPKYGSFQNTRRTVSFKDFYKEVFKENLGREYDSHRASTIPEAIKVIRVVEPKTVHEQIEDDYYDHKQRSKSREIDSKYRALIKQLEAKDESLQIALEIRDQIHITPILPNISKKLTSVCPIAMASDWHCGERIDRKSVNNLNEFNPDIAKIRSELFFQNLLKLINNSRHDVNIEELVLWLGGDFISGFIHPELIQENYMSPTQEIIFAQDLLISGITFLLNNAKLKRLIIPTSYGNHDRYTIKMQNSAGYKTSFAQLMYWNMARYFKSEPKVEFSISDSYFNYLDIYDKKLRFHHGDNINYQSGIGGLSIPMLKFINRSNLQIKADLDCIGHWHQTLIHQRFRVNGCFPKDMMVTVETGKRKPIQDIKVGDIVLTKSGEYLPVVNTSSRKHSDRLINILWQGKHSEIKCTPNHNFWVIKKNQVPSDIRYYEGEKTKYKKSTPFISPQWVPAEYLSIGDYLHIQHDLEVIDNVDLPNDMCRLIGLFLAEGAVGGRNGKAYQASFTFHIKENHLADFVEKTLKKYFGKATQSERKYKTIRSVVISSSEVCSYFVKLCGRGAHHKNMSADLMKLPIEKQLEIGIGWLQGDGHVAYGIGSKGRYRHVSGTSVSYDLVCQLQQLFLRCGFFPKFFYQEKGGRRKSDSYSLAFGKEDAIQIAKMMGEEIDSEKYRVTSLGALTHNGELFVPISSIYSEPFDGEVFNLEVNKDHSYIINGVTVKNSLCGFDGYAIKIAAEPERPQQQFFLVDSKRGFTGSFPIICEP